MTLLFWFDGVCGTKCQEWEGEFSGVPKDSGGKEPLEEDGGRSWGIEGQGAELSTGTRGGNCTLSRDAGNADEQPDEAVPGNKME